MLADAGGLSWNLGADLQGLFAYHFMVNAFRSGTVVAISAALIGWFMVLRRESFVGHTLALVGFPGAAGATLLGIAPTAGFLVFCLAGALTVAGFSRGDEGRGFSEESAVVGIVQAIALAAGFFFISLYRGFLSGVNALLFGSFLGITDAQFLALAAVAVMALAALTLIARPLLFASVDPTIAAVNGVPVGAVSLVFLLVLGTAAAESSQITGALLVFALLVMPAAAAQLLSARPALSLALSVAIGVAVTWIGLGAAYYSSYPAGFFITTLAFVAYAGARLWRGGIVGARHGVPLRPGLPTP